MRLLMVLAVAVCVTGCSAEEPELHPVIALDRSLSRREVKAKAQSMTTEELREIDEAYRVAIERSEAARGDQIDDLMWSGVGAELVGDTERSEAETQAAAEAITQSMREVWELEAKREIYSEELTARE